MEAVPWPDSRPFVRKVRMRLLPAVLLAVLSLVLAPTATGTPDPTPERRLGDVVEPTGPPPKAIGILATARDTVSPQVIAAIEDVVGRDVVGQTEIGSNTVAVKFTSPMSAERVDDLSSRLAALPQISAVSPDLVATPDATPNDTYYPRQTNLYTPAVTGASSGTAHHSIDVPSIWDATTGSRTVVVAVVDGGIAKHTDLSGQTVAGYDMVSDKRYAGDGNGRDSNPADPGNYSDGTYCSKYNSSWHGTHVAGIIGAVRGNKKGIAGIAPGVSVQPVRVVGRCFTPMSDIIAGIRWASGGKVDGVPMNKTPAQVINLSLSSTVTDFTCPVAYQEVIDEARARGSLVVVSAGNQSASVLTRTPSNCRGVLSVGAIAPDGSPTTYTNVGRTLGMVAPGGVDPDHEPGLGIWSTIDKGKKKPAGATYGQMSGTSMAAPTVSAAAALIFSLGDFTADQVMDVLKTAAVQPPKYDQYYTCRSDDELGNERNVCGAGILNLAGVPAPVLRPAVVGEPVPGTALDMTQGRFNGEPSSVEHEWLRDGVPIQGQTGPTYTVTMDDLGRALSVRATAHTPGYPDFSSTSSAVTVPLVASTVDLRLSATKVSRKTPVVATATVGAAADVPVTGTVTFLVGSKKVATAPVVDGVAEVTLPLFKSKKKYTIQAQYSGSATVAAKSSSKVKVTVK